ncbi:hypothetical protein E2C01_002187 [Portunus trituberculatus]|uniref:Uncharacterized protein n=1 Tax=Portunus trituberculatus TaxID=210409 RepID=A0A5B7CIR0_PORTR|nr:hypothetical protein [Portunus trituberculatus]
MDVLELKLTVIGQHGDSPDLRLALIGLKITKRGRGGRTLGQNDATSPSLLHPRPHPDRVPLPVHVLARVVVFNLFRWPVCIGLVCRLWRILKNVAPGRGGGNPRHSTRLPAPLKIVIVTRGRKRGGDIIMCCRCMRRLGTKFGLGTTRRQLNPANPDGASAIGKR